jgi:transposase
MLNLTYSYRIYPGLDQEAQMLDWLEQCRRVYNYALAERKDWIDSRKCPVNACSIRDTACGGRLLGSPDEAGKTNREEGKPALYPLG